MKKIAQSTGLWAGCCQGSNSGKGECFVFLRKRRDWLLGSHNVLFSVYWTALGIKRPGREPNNSPVSSAQVMMFGINFPLALHLQLNEQQKVKAVRVSKTDSTVKCGLAAVQIGTALLVNVSVFRCLV